MSDKFSRRAFAALGISVIVAIACVESSKAQPQTLPANPQNQEPFPEPSAEPFLGEGNPPVVNQQPLPPPPASGGLQSRPAPQVLEPAPAPEVLQPPPQASQPPAQARQQPPAQARPQPPAPARRQPPPPAQARRAPPPPPSQFGQANPQFDTRDPQALRNFGPRDDALERRLAFLHDQIRITARQEPLWRAFADAVRGEQRLRDGFDGGFDPRDRFRAPSALDRLEQRQRRLLEQSASVDRLVGTLRPLYDAFSAEQRRVADLEMFRPGAARLAGRFGARAFDGRFGGRFGGQGFDGRGLGGPAYPDTYRNYR